MKYLVFMLSVFLCSTASAQYYQSGGLFFSTVPQVYPAPVVHQVATVSPVTTISPVITYSLPPQRPTMRSIFAPRASYVGSVQYRATPLSITTVSPVIISSPFITPTTVFQTDTVVERITHDPITGTITKEVPAQVETVGSKKFKWVPGKWQEED